jgi:hypothetical protein
LHRSRPQWPFLGIRIHNPLHRRRSRRLRWLFCRKPWYNQSGRCTTQSDGQTVDTVNTHSASKGGNGFSQRESPNHPGSQIVRLHCHRLWHRSAIRYLSRR